MEGDAEPIDDGIPMGIPSLFPGEDGAPAKPSA
jgi:hypothetical protein